MELSYTLYGRPLSWARAGSHGHQRFTRANVRLQQKRHREAAELARPDGWPLGARYLLRLALYTSGRAGDIDNLTKLVMDSLQGVAYDDDAYVSDLEIRRRSDKSDPRTEVTLLVKEGES